MEIIPKTYILLLLGLSCLVPPLSGEDPAKPNLGELVNELLPLFPEGEDKPVIQPGTSTDSLSIHYRTREFMVHGRSMTGKISEKARKTIGPSYRGLMFHIQVQPQDTVNQAVTPQVLRDPYWQTYINHLVFDGYSLFYSVKYGVRTDKTLTNSIIKELNSLPGQLKRRP